jgi:putative flippase GtrA
MPSEKRKEIFRIIKFTLFSASAGIIELLAFTLLNELTPWGYWACYLPALVLSVVWNYTLNRRYTFRSGCSYTRQMLMAFLFYLVFTPVSTIAGDWLAEDLGWNEYLVTALNMIANFVLEFLYDRFVVFRGQIDTNDVARRKDGGLVDE